MLENKNILSETSKEINALSASKKWVSVPESSNEKILVKQLVSDGLDFFVKCKAILKADAERLMYVIQDHNATTRLLWDNSITACTYVAHDGGFHITETVIQSNVKLVAARYMLCVHKAIKTKDKTCILMRTTKKYGDFQCPPNMVAMDISMAVFIHPMTDGECELTLICRLNAGTSLINPWSAWVRNRVELYEYAAQNWDTYYKK